MLSFEKEVLEQLELINKTLLEKNAKYGDSALNPKRIFSKASTTEQIMTRIDDKLSRIANEDESEDSVLDLMGYLILLRIHKNRETKS